MTPFLRLPLCPVGGKTDRPFPRYNPTRIPGLFRSVSLGVAILARGAASPEADRSSLGFGKAARNCSSFIDFCEGSAKPSDAFAWADVRTAIAWV
jgi:hypothetical protein